MGLFDRFKRKPTAPPPPPDAGPGPNVPCAATIASYEIADAVGTLALEGGGELRFGRSACKGFEPVVSARVIVEEVAAHPRGWRAKSIRLDPSDPHYDELIAARDAQAGLPERTMSGEQAAATARMLALVTVLLRDALPEGTVALGAWARERKLEANVERDLELVVRGAAVLTYAGRCAFPRDGLDARKLPADFDFGRAFLGLGGRLRGSEIPLGRGAFADDGWARQLGRLVIALAPHATGVVLHRAGELVVPIDEFVAMLGDLDDPDCIPFAAWLDIGIAPRAGTDMYGTYGMDAFGLPDVLAPVERDDRWSRSRRHEAVLFASHRMIREVRPLRGGETLRVPFNVGVGAWPIELREEDAGIEYTVGEDGSCLVLLPGEEIGPRDALNRYQALFARGLGDAIPSELEQRLTSRDGEAPPHVLEVRARDDGRGWLVVTNGLGRKLPFEIAVWAPRRAPRLLQIIGALASDATSAWKANDTLALSLDREGIGGFVLADGGQVDVDEERIGILLLVPLAPGDYAQVRGGGAAAWLAKHPLEPSVWDAFLRDG